MRPSTPTSVRTYGMHERADHLDFDIRFQGARNELTLPHRHAYFQIQVGIEGSSQQAIGGEVRPFGPRHLSFVLPYRVHVIPHPPDALYCIVNFDQRFLWPELDVDPLDLEDVPLARHPDLAPFLFQEYVDFAFDEADFARIRCWLDELHALNASRSFGAKTAMRGILQQVIGLACMRQEQALMRLSLQHDGKTSQRDALQRVVRYVRDNLDKPLSLTDAAAAAFLSPNYLANLLRKETDRTFTDLVTERRIERAKELLSSTSLLVREIAHQCGFADEAYFNRRFRQVVGSTPRNFRREHVVGRGV